MGTDRRARRAGCRLPINDVAAGANAEMVIQFGMLVPRRHWWAMLVEREVVRHYAGRSNSGPYSAITALASSRT